MTGTEIAVAAYLFAWAKRRGKPLSERAGQEADTAGGLLMDQLHELVVGKLGARSQGLERLERKAAAGAEKLDGTTGTLVSASLTAAMEDDPGFADALRQVVAGLQAAEAGGAVGGGVVSGNTFNGPAALQSGSRNRQTNHFGM